MGILLTKLFSDATDRDFRLAQDLVAIAMADGEISETEHQAILKVCKEQGISKEVAEDYLKGTERQERAEMPATYSERTDYVKKLILVMGADGYSSRMEIYLLQLLASQLGLHYLQLVALVLETATRKNFPGDTGSKILASFLKNTIDPKSKTLQQNYENMQAIFDTVCRNVLAQQEAGRDDGKALEAALHRTKSLLQENTLLAKEFKTMGINYERVLDEERQLALNRWSDPLRQLE